METGCGITDGWLSVLCRNLNKDVTLKQFSFIALSADGSVLKNASHHEPNLVKAGRSPFGWARFVKTSAISSTKLKIIFDAQYTPDQEPVPCESMGPRSQLQSDFVNIF